MFSHPPVLSWRAELKQILDVCIERASMPVALPHCAICARYSTDNLPFLALLSFLDVLPEESRLEALAEARDRTASVPSAMRQIQVDVDTLPALMDAPGWPLVRSLVIDLADQEIHKYFSDPRLKAIEEITLLGFAYGGCTIEENFYAALFESEGFSGVRTLTLHSTESDAELAKRFWSSGLARRLEAISGVPYFGDAVTGPLSVREISLAGFRGDGISMSRLLDPEVTPHLVRLSLGAYAENLVSLLQLVERERVLFERIETVDLRCADYGGDNTRLLETAVLPATASSVSWYSDFRHVSRIRVNSGWDVRTLYDSTSEKVNIRCGDLVTDYSGLVFDWRLRNEISRRVSTLLLLLPLDLDINEVIEFCASLPGLRNLTLIYPFSESELETLLRSESIRGLEALSLCLSIEGGQWDFGARNEYMAANESRYRSRIPANWLFAWAFGPATSSIPNLSIAAPGFEVSRTPGRIQHCDIDSIEAAQALAAIDPRSPIEVLCFSHDFGIDGQLAEALVNAEILGRVFRLNLNARLDEAAAKQFADCEKLRAVRAFSFSCYHNSIESIEFILQSPHLSGVWNLSLNLPALSKLPGSEGLCAASPLLDRAVALGLGGTGEKSPLTPASGRLARVWQVDESLSMSVFGDGRLAAVWLKNPLGRPLKAKLRATVARIYRIDYEPEDLPGLVQKLLSFPAYHEEREFERTLQAVLATAFGGKPVAEGTRFIDLTEQQQHIVKEIARVEESWWHLDMLMYNLMRSYGFPYWGKDALEKYIAGSE